MTKISVGIHGWIRHEDKYLVIRRAMNGRSSACKWDLPGGSAKIGESAEEALVRETMEETGLSIEIGRILFVYNHTLKLPRKQTFQLVYACRYITGEVTLSPREHDGFAWIRKEEVENLASVDFLEAFRKSDAFKEI